MERISTIGTAGEAELEEMREDLRDRRWARRRSMIGVIGRWILVIMVGVGLDFHFDPALLIRSIPLL